MHATFFDEGYGYDVFGMHPPTLARTAAAGAPIYEHYFRVRSEGIAQVPREGPAILVANHGGVLPVDAAMLWLDVVRKLARVPRCVADQFVPKLPLVSTLFARCGAVSGTRANVAHLLARGELLAIWPEGVSGPAKPYRDRYRLQAWSVGFAELAIRHRAPVVPVAIVGAEEAWPLATKLGVRWFGAPYLPIPRWPLPRPTRIAIGYGAPIDLGDGDADDPTVVAAAAARVHDALAAQLAALRVAHGDALR